MTQETIRNRIVGHEDVAPDQLLAHPQNFRRHPGEQLEALRGSLGELGWVKDIVVNRRTGNTIDGHARIEEALRQNAPTVPVTYVDLSDEEERLALAVLDPITEMALRDQEALDKLLEDARAEDPRLQALLDEMRSEPPPESGLLNGTDEDAVPEVPEEPKAKLGEIYALGAHRLMCGNAIEKRDVWKLLDGESPTMIFTDPPYGVNIVSADTSKVGGDKPFGKVGTIHKGMKAKPIVEANVYPAIIGDDSTETAVRAFRLCEELKAKVSIWWGGNYYADELPPSSCWIVWDKDNGESFFADAELAWTNQETAVRIFKHRWNSLIKASEQGEKRVHPTQKPVALAQWCFEKYGEVGDRVLDLFGGSGSTLIACEKTGRIGYLMEMAPAYVDVIIDRWEKATGKKAELISG